MITLVPWSQGNVDVMQASAKTKRMSDSEDKSPHRRSKITEKPSEDSSSKSPSDKPEDSSAKTVDEDASKDKPVEGSPCSYGGARPKVFLEKEEDKSRHKQSKTDEPSCSYGGARPKVYSEKKSETKKSSNVKRAVEMLESTLRKQERLVRRRREEVEKESTSEHLDLVKSCYKEFISSSSGAVNLLAINSFTIRFTGMDAEKRGIVPYPWSLALDFDSFVILGKCFLFCCVIQLEIFYIKKQSRSRHDFFHIHIPKDY
ncbi:hypothetical protein TNIN_353241 [Trichonephila inaurata madagascariensis]|uniref:Uncharacterized protein n=1 Tax=Trichonephila inaurata madagascariensis TaxID=2747483 RepID=A0A8X6IZF9_9ARAC|nr:hypothetical protein TNIN_353241 [Trichonephila inaurata madagascariensis]